MKVYYISDRQLFYTFNKAKIRDLIAIEIGQVNTNCLQKDILWDYQELTFYNSIIEQDKELGQCHESTKINHDTDKSLMTKMLSMYELKIKVENFHVL